MKLFFVDIRPTSELPDPHACWYVYWIFHSCFCMHYQSLLLSLCVAMHFTVLLTFNYLSASRADLDSGFAFNKDALCNLGKECSPSSPYLHILDQNYPLDYLAHLWRIVASWSKKLCKSILGPTILPSWNCTLRNPNSQLLDWIVHFIDLVASPTSEIA